MSAKSKLNAGNFLGAVLISGLVYAATKSFGMFVAALVSLLVAGLVAGDIRR